MNLTSPHSKVEYVKTETASKLTKRFQMSLSTKFDFIFWYQYGGKGSPLRVYVNFVAAE